MIIAVVVAVKVEVEMTKSGERLADETLETDNLPQGVVEPTPTARTLVRLYPAASMLDVHGVWEPPPQPEPVPVTRPADEICRH